MSKIVIVGAGKTGRGFLARLLQEAEKEVVFIDKNKELVGALNTDKEFQVRFFGGVRETYTVNNFVAYTWENVEVKEVLEKDAELIFVVGPAYSTEPFGNRCCLPDGLQMKDV